MCGIAGIWNFNQQTVELRTLERFTDSIAHRGPDGAGYWLNKTHTLGLGHRRLSILDTSENGTQPMHSKSGKYAIVFNGEIFNFIELKEELSAKYDFTTDTDTEVILAAFEEWGHSCVERFNGMWAIAIYDKFKDSLFLSRDRWGIKPLYYSETPKGFYFASETIAFRSLDNYKREVNSNLCKKAISDFESLEGFGYTIFNNINLLLPGHNIYLRQGNKVKQKKWWDTRKQKVVVPSTYKDQQEEFFRLFEDSCRLRLRSDVPVGTALSGGLDSSAVYCMLNYIACNGKLPSRLPSDWQRAFVAVFPGEHIDEKKYAQEVLKYINSDGTFIEVDANKVSDDIYNSTYLFDSISGSPINAVANMYGGMKKNGVTVSLDGHGVDEMMYGYKMLVKGLAASYHNSSEKERFGDIVQTYANLFFQDDQEQKVMELRKYLENIGRPSTSHTSYFIKKLIKQKLGLYKLSPARAKQFLRSSIDSNYSLLSNDYDDYGDLEASDRLKYDTFHKTTLPTVLRNFDRASMQSSVEVRMPFMDYRLVSYVLSLPSQSLVANGYTKRILRDSLKSIMPPVINQRKLKLGFPVPLVSWIKSDCKNMILDITRSQSFVASDLWEGEKISEWVESNYKNNLWTEGNVNLLWPYINAHIITR